MTTINGRFRATLQHRLLVITTRALPPTATSHLTTRTTRYISDFVLRIDDPERADRVALIDCAIDRQRSGNEIRYGDLSRASIALAVRLASSSSSKSNTGGSIGCFIGGHSDFVVAMLASWRLGRRFVPLAWSHPPAELNYFLTDSKIDMVLFSSAALARLSPRGLTTAEAARAILLEASPEGVPLAVVDVSQGVDGDTASAATAADVAAGLSAAETTTSLSIDDLHTDALVLYTSGTTGRPKGAVHTRAGVLAHMQSLCAAWEYAPSDRLLHFLPLHHLHGLLNKLLCVLYAGGSVEFLKSTSPLSIWQRLGAEPSAHTTATSPASTSSSSERALTIFMAVPTVYARMLELSRRPSQGQSKELGSESLDDATLQRAVLTLARMRVNVSGSAALPDPITDQWRSLTGQALLERYGMTELGMVLSNPLHGPKLRGCVGLPLPTVVCRLVATDEDGGFGDREVGEDELEVPGELRVKGPGVFRTYLNKADATAGAFDEDGWFKTGDVAVRVRLGDGVAVTVHEGGGVAYHYRLLGRASSDIIKSSGYKLSALEIERELLAHPQVAEAAVVGQPDPVLGERVVAVMVLREQPNVMEGAGSMGGGSEALHANNVFQVERAMRAFLEKRLAHYKQPQRIYCVTDIPRNHMGKVNKKTLLKELQLV